MRVSRRAFMKTSALSGLALLANPGDVLSSALTISRSAMGVAMASYANRWGAPVENSKIPGFENALQVLQHCESIGAGGVQVGARNWSDDFTGKVRDFREKKGLYLEGSIRLPQDKVDLDRFTTETRNSMEAGATILRTVCLSGRRYENFDSSHEFQQFRKSSIASIQLTLPILKKYKVKLAIENHKDWRTEDLLELLEYFDSEWVGVNLDTGNNISFLEDPMKVIESLAPYSFTTHLKDMAVLDYSDGFLLSEVPLGTGSLDLEKVILLCQQHNPNIRFNLEMITRNPLKVPCFTDKYWQTFDELPAAAVAPGLNWVRKHQSGTQLPTVEGMSRHEKLVYEEQNILDSFKYANNQLKLEK